MLLGPTADDDPAHVYDQMVHASRELLAALLASASDGETTAALARAVRLRVASINPEHIETIREARDSFDQHRLLLLHLDRLDESDGGL